MQLWSNSLIMNKKTDYQPCTRFTECKHAQKLITIWTTDHQAFIWITDLPPLIHSSIGDETVHTVGYNGGCGVPSKIP